MAYPKVLIIGTGAFNRITGGGITMTNLFSGWPKNKISTIHQDNLAPDLSVCENNFRLTSGEIRENILGRLLRGIIERTPLRDRFYKKYPAIFNGTLFQQKIHLSDELRNWIADFSPDVIYSMMGSNEVMELTKQTVHITSASLIIHFMDDWPLTIYQDANKYFGRHARMRKLLQWHLDSACLRLAISPHMAAEYSDRYGYDFQSFQNVIDVQRWKRNDDDKISINRKCRVLYAGSIYDCAQDQSLIDVCKCVSNLSKDGVSISLEIYSHEMFVGPYLDRLKIDKNIIIHNELDDDVAFFDALKKADILLLPVNFDKRSIDYIRLSMPTKIPAFLCSGTPILVYGPLEVAQVQYAQEAGWGGVVSARNESMLKSMIMRLISDENMRSVISRKALICAEQNHDSKRIRAEFQNSLKGCIENNYDFC